MSLEENEIDMDAMFEIHTEHGCECACDACDLIRHERLCPACEKESLDNLRNGYGPFGGGPL